MVLGQNGLVLVGTWWYWVSMERYWLISDSTGSVEGNTGLFMMVVGQYRSVLDDTCWYWVSMGRYWLELGSTGSVWSGSG